MTQIFLICATIGGTVLVFQFILGLLGFMDFGVEIVDDMDVDFDVSGGADGGEVGGSADQVDGTSHAGGADGIVHSVSAWMWSMLSLRNLTALLTFFGLAGMAARTQGASPTMQWTIALIVGGTAMYAVHWLMRTVFRLARDSTMQVKQALGQTGTVYLPIPASRSGSGKVHIAVQGRLEEFDALTSWPDRLGVGAKVVVVAIADGETLVVDPVAVKADPADKLAQSV